MERHKMQFTLEKKKYTVPTTAGIICPIPVAIAAPSISIPQTARKNNQKSIRKPGDHSKHQTKTRFSCCDKKGLVQRL